MSRAWMPFYVGDYLADTAHLSTQEHGAYLLLIMHYWQTGSLPNDDARLARIARLTLEEWERARDTLASFFGEGWKHGRVEDELAKADKLSAAGRAGGLASGRSRGSPRTVVERSGNDQATVCEAPQSPSQSPKKIKSLERCEVKGWSPPSHGATSQRDGRVYVEQGSSEWAAYAEDYRKVHFHDPEPNAHGGKWFRILGEAGY